MWACSCEPGDSTRLRNAGISGLYLASRFILIGLLLDEDFGVRDSPSAFCFPEAQPRTVCAVGV